MPLLSALGGLLLIVGLSWTWAGRLLTLASLGLVVLFVLIVRRHATIYTWTMAAGSVAWLVGNVLGLMGRPLYTVAPWWVAFLVLTIAGERLELSRVLRPSRRVIGLFAGAVGGVLAGEVLSVWVYDAGVRLAGLGLVLLAAWLLRFDLAPVCLLYTSRCV